LNSPVLQFFRRHEAKLLDLLTNRGSEIVAIPEWHEYEFDEMFRQSIGLTAPNLAELEVAKNTWASAVDTVDMYVR
jgi:hypothetical protein